MAKVKRNIKSSVFQRLLGNKNTVTLLGVIACILTLVIGYNIRLNSSISPISVPYAKQTITARSTITPDMIGQVKISKSYIDTASNVITDPNKIVDSKASYKSNIPAGSLFYKELVKSNEEMPDSAFADIPTNYTIFSLSVSEDETYDNSIRAGDYIDLYMSATDPGNDNRVIYAELIQSIRVLAVKDSKGNNILKNSLAYGKPAELLFSVPEELYLLLMRAQYLEAVKVKIEPVLRNAQYTIDGTDDKTQVSSKTLEDFINLRVKEMI